MDEFLCIYRQILRHSVVPMKALPSLCFYQGSFQPRLPSCYFPVAALIHPSVSDTALTGHHASAIPHKTHPCPYTTLTKYHHAQLKKSCYVPLCLIKI